MRRGSGWGGEAGGDGEVFTCGESWTRNHKDMDGSIAPKCRTPGAVGEGSRRACETSGFS
jgi:hypothetical protein